MRWALVLSTKNEVVCQFLSKLHIYMISISLIVVLSTNERLATASRSHQSLALVEVVPSLKLGKLPDVSLARRSLPGD